MSLSSITISKSDLEQLNSILSQIHRTSLSTKSALMDLKESLQALEDTDPLKLQIQENINTTEQAASSMETLLQSIKHFTETAEGNSRIIESAMEKSASASDSLDMAASRLASTLSTLLSQIQQSDAAIASLNGIDRFLQKLTTADGQLGCSGSSENSGTNVRSLLDFKNLGRDK